VTTPRLSVAVINYNYARFLPACLESILSQTFGDIEVIIVDDCSSDGSREVIERFLADDRVRLVAHGKNQGFSASLREGMGLARGEFITAYDADDIVLRPQAFERQIAALERHPSAVLAFSAVDRFYDATGEVYEAHRVFDSDTLVAGAEAFRRYLTDRNFWAPNSGTIVRRAAYEACGGYPAGVTVGLDFSLYSSLALEGDFAYIAEPLHGYRNHAAQMSINIKPIRKNTPEFLSVIDLLCDRAEERGIGARTLRREALQTKLSGLALQDAFSDRPRLALVRTWDLFRRRPLLVLTSKDFAVTVLRSVLGRRAFEFVRGAVRRESSSAMPTQPPHADLID